MYFSQVQKLQTIMFLPMLFQIGTSCVILTLTGYQVSMKSQDFSIVPIIHSLHVVFLFAELGFYCHRGEQLKTECSKIKLMLLEGPWYNSSVSQRGRMKLKKIHSIITIILLKSNQDVVISAGGIAGLTHATFQTVSFWFSFPFDFNMFIYVL